MKSITTKVVGLFLSFVHGIIFYRKDEDWGHGIVEEYFPDMLKPWVWKGKQYKVSNYILLVAASGFKTGKINWINLISSAILYNSLYTTTSTMGSLSTETNIWSNYIKQFLLDRIGKTIAFASLSSSFLNPVSAL
jgi:hypothetical protein